MIAKDDLFSLIAHTGQALAHGKRLEVLELLAQHPRSVNDLAALAQVKVSTVSAHLRVLREAGLVTPRREGTHVIYDLAGEDVAALLASLMDVAERHGATVRDARARYLPEADTVTFDQLALMRQAGQVMVLDVRPADEFAAGHLPGAVNVPLAELPMHAPEIPDDVAVVVYCRGRFCALSREARTVLAAQGRTVHILPAGVADWHLRTRWQAAS